MRRLTRRCLRQNRKAKSTGTPAVTITSPSASGVLDFGARTVTASVSGFPGTLTLAELLDGSTVIASTSSFGSGTVSISYTVPANNAGPKSISVRVTDSLSTVVTSDAINVTFGQAIADLNAIGFTALYWGRNGLEDTGNSKSGVQFSRWNDLTGNGNHATQSTTALQPTATTDSSDEALYFDPLDTGGNSLDLPSAVLTALSGASNATIIFAARRTSPGTAIGAINFDVVDLAASIGPTNNFAVDLGGTSKTGYYAHGTNTNAHLWFIAFAGGGSTNADRLKIDEDTVSQTLSFVGTISTTVPTLSAGRIGLKTDATARWRGYIYAVAIVAKALSASEKTSAIAAFDSLLAFR